MRHDSVYTSKNIVVLVTIFVTIFWLLYSLGSFLHESKKIQDEIDAIAEQNEKIRWEIEEKKQHLSYLKTTQRVDKEAKMQMGKKLPGEKVIMFVPEKIGIVAEPSAKPSEKTELQRVSVWEKWRWVLGI